MLIAKRPRRVTQKPVLTSKLKFWTIVHAQQSNTVTRRLRSAVVEKNVESLVDGQNENLSVSNSYDAHGKLNVGVSGFLVAL